MSVGCSATKIDTSARASLYGVIFISHHAQLDLAHLIAEHLGQTHDRGISFTCSCQHLLARGGRSRRYVSHPACAVQRARALLKAAAQGDKIESLQSFQIFVHDDFTTHIGMLASGHFAAYATAGISLPKSNT